MSASTAVPMGDAAADSRWLPDLSRARGAKYQAIAEALAVAVAGGVLSPGDRLPPQRHVAEALGVDLTTVTRAYDAARQRGLIEARGRSGSFVRTPPRTELPTAAAVEDSSMNMPPDVPNGLLARLIAETIPALLGRPGAFAYAPPGGRAEDRAAGARLLAARGMASEDEQIVITAGGQHALHAILSSQLQPGDAVACGRFVYPGFRALAQRLGLQLVALDALTAEALDAVARQQPVRMLYLVPTNDNPTAATIGAAERRWIAQVAEARDISIIEDDAYGALAEAAPTPFAFYAPQRTWHIASVSKTISPGLRVAHVRAPGLGDAMRLATEVHETTVMAPPLNVAMVTAWATDGGYDRLVGAMRAEAAARQAIAAVELAGLHYAAHPQGYHLWLPLPSNAAAADIGERMRGSGLSAIASDRFAVGPTTEQALRVSLGGGVDHARLARGLRLLRACVTAPMTRAPALI